VEQLLDVARFQRGTRRPPSTVDLTTVVEDATEIFSDLAHEAGLSLEVRVDKGLRVEADADGLAQVVTNLLSNALKFTPRGGQLIIRASEEGGECVVSVQDSGLGLTPEQTRRLFDPFVQLHEATHPTGSGLGLFISKGIVEAYGGKLRVESPGPGQGATFSFGFPASAAKAGRAAEPRS
jgi:signal transduction histidine kinase